MNPEVSLEDMVKELAGVARLQLDNPLVGNWFSVTFSHGDFAYQYAFYYRNGALVAEQCNNICPMPDLNIRSRAEKREQIGNGMTIYLLAKDQRQREHRVSSRAVLKELVRWFWKTR